MVTEMYDYSLTHACSDMKSCTFTRPQPLFLFNYMYLYITHILKRHQIKQNLVIVVDLDGFSHVL